MSQPCSKTKFILLSLLFTLLNAPGCNGGFDGILQTIGTTICQDKRVQLTAIAGLTFIAKKKIVDYRKQLPHEENANPIFEIERAINDGNPLDEFAEGTVPPIIFSKLKRLEHPELYRLAIDKDNYPRNLLLLYGEPGFGKTLIAQKMQETLNSGYIEILAGELLKKHIGDTEKAIVKKFQKAEMLATKHGTCIVLLDEGENLLANREMLSDHNKPYYSGTTFWGLLDKYRKTHPNIFIVVTTNKYKDLDPAFARRASAHSIQLPYEEKVCTNPLTKVKLYQCKQSKERAEKIFSALWKRFKREGFDSDWDNLIYLLQNFSDAEITEIIEEAARYALEDYYEANTPDEFNNQKNRISQINETVKDCKTLGYEEYAEEAQELLENAQKELKLANICFNKEACTRIIIRKEHILKVLNIMLSNLNYQAPSLLTKINNFFSEYNPTIQGISSIFSIVGQLFSIKGFFDNRAIVNENRNNHKEQMAFQIATEERRILEYLQNSERNMQWRYEDKKRAADDRYQARVWREEDLKHQKQ